MTSYACIKKKPKTKNQKQETNNSEANLIIYSYDGSSSSAPLLATFSGTNIVGAFVVSSGRTLFLHFVSDYSIENNGFNVDWRGTLFLLGADHLIKNV